MNINNAPDKGMMYALYIDRMVFKPYTKEELLNDLYLQDKLLELHLFDKDKEYRYINASNKEIETIISDDVDYDDTYIEEVYCMSKADEDANKDSKKIGVINYIKYDENDLLNICNYRLKELNDGK